MHQYLPHLLSDIKAAHRTQVPQEPKTIEEQLEDAERYVTGEGADRTFGHYCGLKPEQFPPVEQLSADDMQQVCEAFKEMMRTWNLEAAFPDKLPIERGYPILIGILNEHTMILNVGSIYFDYCSGGNPDCVFKEYCPCRD